MNLQNNNLLLQVQKVLKLRKCKKPEVVTNYLSKDMLVENDLSGKDLLDINNIEKIRLLSSDITTFNDEAYRYYLIQFIEQFYLNEKSIFLLMFIQSFFQGDCLSKNSKRYLQFSSNEVKVILNFLKYPFEDNDFQMETQQAILFWNNHPKLKFREQKIPGQDI